MTWLRFAALCAAGFAIGALIGTVGAELAMIRSLRKAH